MMFTKNTFTSIFSGVLLVAAVLGCGGGRTCTAELDVRGKTYKGNDKDIEQAKKNACTGYCIEGNPDFDIAFEKWLKTPEAENIAEQNIKWTAQYKDKGLLELVERCETVCKDFTETGVYKLNASCQ